MSGVKRYVPEGYTQPASRSGMGTHMVESRDGDYVLASDYDALSQRCKELEGLLAEATAQCEFLDKQQSDACFRREKAESQCDNPPAAVKVPRELADLVAYALHGSGWFILHRKLRALLDGGAE